MFFYDQWSRLENEDGEGRGTLRTLIGCEGQGVISSYAKFLSIDHTSCKSALLVFRIRFF